MPKTGTKNKQNKDMKKKYEEILKRRSLLRDEKNIKTIIPIAIYAKCLKKKK
tara:strand:- start:267 stop:422 length:156 start_codon:yes stop_codon:yes gene_type:complete